MAKLRNLELTDTASLPGFEKLLGIVRKKLNIPFVVHVITPSTNKIFKLTTSSGDSYILKVYFSERGLPSNEIFFCQKFSYLPFVRSRELIFSDTTKKKFPYDYAIYRFIPGKTLLEKISTISQKKLKFVLKDVLKSLEPIWGIRTNNFGSLDSSLNGNYNSWLKFLFAEQANFWETFALGPTTPFQKFVVKNIPRILVEKSHLFRNQKSFLCPMDISPTNILISTSGEVVLFDLETLYAGDPLSSLADIILSFYGTPIADFIQSGFRSMDKKNILCLNIYLILSALEIQAFLYRQSGNYISQKPFCSPYTFEEIVKKLIKDINK